MNIPNHTRPLLYGAIALGLATAMVGCGKKEEAPAAAATAPAAATQATAQQAPAAGQASIIPPAAAMPTSWTAEAMEELLAPIALYPDPILTQVLTAAANPQEVLDAGNWLLLNQTLKGSELNAAAEKVGFTPPMRALLPFPATVDMMCQEMAWTAELGQAFVTDQQGVLDAVQRLRLQAQEVGNLQDSPQMDVAVEEQDGEQVIYLKPADPEVVYVPQYDPVAAYAPATTTTVPATTTTTVVEEGHSTGTLVATGLLSFGAGLLVADLFDDDDDWDDDWNDYYPRYGYGGGYYRPPYPYRPAYGNGYYPNHGYNRPPNYNNGWQNNGNINTGDININTGGNRVTNTSSRLKTGNSPISKANPNRDMAKVNDRTNKNRAGATAGGASNWKGQSGYAGAKNASSGKPTAQQADRARQQASTGGKAMPKQQGGYNGAKTASRDAQRPTNKTASRDVQKPQNKQTQQRPQQQKPQNKQAQQRPQQQKPQNKQAQQRPQQNSQSRDRGHSSGGSRQQTASRQSPSRSNGSMSGASRGSSDRSSSQRGKQSSGGGSGNKSRR